MVDEMKLKSILLLLVLPALMVVLMACGGSAEPDIEATAVPTATAVIATAVPTATTAPAPTATQVPSMVTPTPVAMLFGMRMAIPNPVKNYTPY